MPVGQAVTATRLRRLGAGAAAAAGGVRRGSGRGRGAAPTTSVTSVGDLLGRLGVAQRVGERRLDQRPGQLGQQLQVGVVAAGRGRDQEHQVGRAVLGAEVDLRLRAGRTPASARSTPAVRQCGIAMPPGRPVADFASRAKASSTSWSTSVARPASPTIRASARITSCLSEPRSASRRTRSGVDEVGHGHPPGVRSRRRTETSSGRTWWGCGMVVPGSPAAALP